MDVRFLPNPYYVPELSSGTGKDKDVAGYVLNNHAAEEFFRHLIPLLVFLIESHERSGRSPLLLAIGCTGGKHRSVAVVENLKELLEDKGVAVTTSHRDIDKV